MNEDIGRREFLKRTGMAGALVTSGLPSLETLGGGTHAPIAESAQLAVADRQLDSQEFCLSEYDAITPALRFTAKDAAAARTWKAAARERLVERVGGFPRTRVPLRPESLETKDFGSYTREKIIFQTRENLSAVGYLLLPAKRSGPLPT